MRLAPTSWNICWEINPTSCDCGRLPTGGLCGVRRDCDGARQARRQPWQCLLTPPWLAVRGYNPTAAVQIALAGDTANMIKMHGAKPVAKEG